VEKKTISLGLVSGLLGGLASFTFARLQVTPVIRQAIDFEASGEHGEHADPVVSRVAQENLGAVAGTVLFAMAMGALFAVAFITVSMRLNRNRLDVDPRLTALLLAAAGFVTVNLVPSLIYPANPPGVGRAESIGDRTTAYLIAVALSVTVAVIAVVLAARLVPRVRGWVAVVTGVFGYGVTTSATALVLPRFDETSPGFPAAVLSDFRLYSVLSQAIVWLVIGATFAALLPRITGAAHAHR
jgi:predicted cobalt transporter CbtA